MGSSKSNKVAKRAPAKRAVRKAAAQPLDREEERLGGLTRKSRAWMTGEATGWLKSASSSARSTLRWSKTGNGWGRRSGRTMGIFAAANAHKDKVKLTFSHGAQLADPNELFNAGLGGKKWRAIDIRAGDKIDVTALKALLREAIEYNSKHSVPESRGSRDI